MIVESSWNAWKHSFRAGGKFAVLLVAVVLLAGCGSVPKTHYYTLQVPAAPSPSDPKTDYILGVEHFRAPQMLRDDRLAYYQTPTEVNFYQYHRWGADPATMLSEFAAQWLDSTGVFAQVRLLPTRQHVDYMLAGRVLHFEEVDEGGPRVRVGLELTLVRASDHKVLWSSEQRVEAPFESGGVDRVASALNASSVQLLRQMIPGLITQVEQDFKNSGK